MSKKKQQSKNKKQSNHSTLKQHIHQGKTLTPPMAALPNLQPTSWLNERLPEMLWAVLLVTHLPRPVMLETFREVADYVSQFQDENSIHDVTHTGFSRAKAEIVEGLLNVITATDDHRVALSPLLLLHQLPAYESWTRFLPAPTRDSWQALMGAVALVLDHQSQEATDCRWVRLMCLVSSGKAVVPPEFVKEIAYYPNYGDMRQVRPSIRAAEIAFWERDDTAYDWAEKFWTQCLSDTPCFPLPSDTPVIPAIGTTPNRVQEVYQLSLVTS